MDEITLKVPGMTCAHCEHAVHDELVKVVGVDDVTVDLATKDVVVRGTGLAMADLVAAVDEAGYEVAAG